MCVILIQVQNPLPTAYFCSTEIGGRIFDSNALRINPTTLRVCLPGQLPVLQPSRPHCANQDLLTPNVIPSATTTFSVITTINLPVGVETQSITFDTAFQRTVMTPTDPTPLLIQTEPRANRFRVGIGVGVSIAMAALLVGLVVGGVILGIICFTKKKERNLALNKRKNYRNYRNYRILNKCK